MRSSIMIWKILFIILALTFCFLNIGGISGGFVLSEFSISLSYIFSCFAVLVLGLFFALGWKKKLFGRKFINFLLVFTFLFFVVSVVISVMTGLNAVAIQVKSQFGNLDRAFYMSTISRLLVLSVLMYAVLYAPVLAGCFIYKRKYENFSEVAKPYWKIFLTYVALTGLISLSSVLVLMDYDNVVCGDVVYLLFMFLKIIFSIGYAYDIRIGNQMFWKISGGPMIAVALAEPFMCSEMFLNLTGQHILLDSYSGVIFEFIVNFVVFYALYRYAFKQDVYKIKNGN